MPTVPERCVHDLVSGTTWSLPVTTPCLRHAPRTQDARPTCLRVIACDGAAATVLLERGRGVEPLRVTDATTALGELDAGSYAYVRSPDFDRDGRGLWWISRIGEMR